jgi:hypothetical protein
MTRIGELRTTLVATSNRNVVPTSQIPATLMMEAIRPSETSVITRATRHHISEDGILHRIQCTRAKVGGTYSYHQFVTEWTDVQYSRGGSHLFPVSAHPDLCWGVGVGGVQVTAR